MNIPMTPNAHWYADGLRWIGTLFHDAADHLESPSFSPAPGEPRAKYLPVEEYLFDVRSRMIQHL